MYGLLNIHEWWIPLLPAFWWGSILLSVLLLPIGSSSYSILGVPEHSRSSALRTFIVNLSIFPQDFLLSSRKLFSPATAHSWYLSLLSGNLEFYSCLLFLPYLSFSFCIALPKPFPIITCQHVFPISFWISSVICSSLKFPHHDQLGFSGSMITPCNVLDYEDLELGTIEPWKRTCSINLSNSGLSHWILPSLVPPILM